MLARFEGGAGHFCLDSAYLARDVCSAISKMGMVPRIQAEIQHDSQRLWKPGVREMVDLSVQDPDSSSRSTTSAAS